MDATFWVGPTEYPDSYQLLTPIGPGGSTGTGQVWRGVRPVPGVSWQEDVAVKVLPAVPAGAGGDAGPGGAGGPGDTAEQQWLGYGNRLTHLNHPGLARVLDVFAGPWMHRRGEPPPSSWARYVVMDLVEGIALTRWLAENPGAPLSTRIAMLSPVAAGLDELHSGRTTQGPLAHGGVKPSNILLRPDSSVVLVDLGAGPTDASGTARMDPYAAPELRAQGAQPTPASDVFAFAATLAQLVIGQPPPVDPYGYLDVAALQRTLSSHPATYRRPALVRQILAALNARPEARPALLSQWLAGAGDAAGQVAPEPSAYPGTAPAPPQKKRSHAGAWIALLLAIVALLIAGYAVGVLTKPEWISNIFHPEQEPTTVHVTETSNATETSPAITETVTTERSPTSTSERTTTSTTASTTTTTSSTSSSTETTTSTEPPTP